MTHAPLAAILTMVAAMACLSLQDVFSKKLMLSLAPAIIIWSRYGTQTTLAVVGIWRRRAPELTRTRQWKLQVLRGCFVVCGSVMGYSALQRMPVAEFTAIYCLVPLTVTLVARFVMKEAVAWPVWLCIAGGMTGALLVARPGGDVDPVGACLALAGVACYTGFQTLTGHLARQDAPLTIQLYTSVLGFVLLSLAVPFFWPEQLAWQELALLVLVSLAGSYGQFFMVLAFSKAPASVVSPFLYAAIGFSALGGWLVFGHLPDGLATLGMLMIAAFGLCAVWLHHRKSLP